MFELVLRAPQALVEPVSDALIDELGALSVSVEDADAGSEGEQALFGEPGMPAPPARLAALDAERAVRRRDRKPTAAAAVLLAQAWAAGLQVRSLRRLAEQDWVRLTQSQFAPVSITPDFWVVPSWHEPPAAARTGDPARPRAGVRHRHAPDHAHVPALDGDAGRRAGPAGGARARLRLRLGHPGHRRGAARRDATSTPWTSTRPPIDATRANAAANGVPLHAGLPDRAQGRYGCCWPTSWPRR